MSDFSKKSFDSWQPQLDWDSPAGHVLQRLIAALEDTPTHITVFGSAPLQLALDRGFISADVDVFSDADLTNAIQQAGLARGQNEIYVEQCGEIVFSAAASWRERAYVHQQDNVAIIFPHPLDILVSKIKRLEPKDLNAFRLVLARTGHPTPEELKIALQRHIDLFRPNFDEERGGDPIANSQTVWRELFGLEINVRQEIIAPALQKRRQAYATDIPNLKSELPTESF